MNNKWWVQTVGLISSLISHFLFIYLIVEGCSVTIKAGYKQGPSELLMDAIIEHRLVVPDNTQV